MRQHLRLRPVLAVNVICLSSTFSYKQVIRLDIFASKNLSSIFVDKQSTGIYQKMTNVVNHIGIISGGVIDCCSTQSQHFFSYITARRNWFLIR